MTPIRAAFAGLALLALAAPAAANRDEDALRSRWHGAWVVVPTEVYSECNASYTNNEVAGRLVKPHGGRRFAPGELGKVHKLDLKRKGLDLLVNLAEPFLRSWQDGPFTLYEQAICKVELKFELPRSTVQQGWQAVDALLAAAVERYADADEAQRSAAWNRRRVEPYPERYEETLAEYRRWQALATNAAVQQRIEDALGEAARVARRVEAEDGEYALGFVEGIEAGSERYVGDCASMLESSPSWKPERRRDGRSGARGEGYEDGYRMARALRVAHELQGCFLPVPGP